MSTAIIVRLRMLQCVAVCCSVSKCTGVRGAVCCSVCFSVLQCVFQCVAVRVAVCCSACCSVLQCVLQCIAVHVAACVAVRVAVCCSRTVAGAEDEHCRNSTPDMGWLRSVGSIKL